MIRRSGEVLLPFPDLMTDHQCERLSVASGTVRVDAASADGGAFEAARDVASGPLRPRAADPVSPRQCARRRAARAGLRRRGVQRRKLGSSRVGAEDQVLALLPQGLVAEPASDLVLALGPQPDALLRSFKVSVVAAPDVAALRRRLVAAAPAAADATAQSLNVAAGLLANGYGWDARAELAALLGR